MSKKSTKYIYVVALGLLLAGVAALVLSGLSGSLQFLKVAEAVPLMEQGQLEAARLFGVVGDDGTQDLDGGGIRFIVHDRENPATTMVVDYRGAVPDTFEPGVEVILEGSLTPGSNVFAATVLTTKCPSKYEQYSGQNQS